MGGTGLYGIRMASRLKTRKAMAWPVMGCMNDAKGFVVWLPQISVASDNTIAAVWGFVA